MLPNDYGPARGEVLEKCTVPFRNKMTCHLYLYKYISIHIYIYVWLHDLKCICWFVMKDGCCCKEERKLFSGLLNNRIWLNYVPESLFFFPSIHSSNVTLSPCTDFRIKGAYLRFKMLFCFFLTSFNFALTLEIWIRFFILQILTNLALRLLLFSSTRHIMFKVVSHRRGLFLPSQLCQSLKWCCMTSYPVWYPQA